MAGKKIPVKSPGIYTTEPGRICTSVRAMFGGITGPPPSVAAYAESDPPGHSEITLRRPGGGKSGGGNINSVAKGGPKGSKVK